MQVALCNPERPVFIGDLATLRNALGAQMGDPVECARVVDPDGNLQQRTTLGLAYYRKTSNAACFTSGWDHWAVTSDRNLVYWAGDSVDPPLNARPLTH
jgi:hypothetical protein